MACLEDPPLSFSAAIALPTGDILHRLISIYFSDEILFKKNNNV
jgi:hypothetical protein